MTAMIRCSACGSRSCPGCAPAPLPSGVPATRLSAQGSQLITPRSLNPTRRAAVTGTVVSHPTFGTGSNGLASVFRSSLLPLAVLCIVTSPGFINFAIIILILAVLGSWCLRKIGFKGAAIPVISIFAFFLRPRQVGPLKNSDVLTFRCDTGTPGAPLQVVRLKGHGEGAVFLGDQIDCVGIRTRNGINALRIQNLTTGMGLYRSGLAAILIFGFLDLAMLSILVSRWVQ